MTMQERISKTYIGSFGSKRDLEIQVNRAKKFNTEEAFLEADDDVMQYDVIQLVEIYRAVHNI